MKLDDNFTPMKKGGEYLDAEAARVAIEVSSQSREEVNYF